MSISIPLFGCSENCPSSISQKLARRSLSSESRLICPLEFEYSVWFRVECYRKSCPLLNFDEKWHQGQPQCGFSLILHWIQGRLHIDLQTSVHRTQYSLIFVCILFLFRIWIYYFTPHKGAYIFKVNYLISRPTYTVKNCKLDPSQITILL